MKKHIPNLITTIRIILIPFVIYYYFKNIYISIALFIISSLTDALDGYLSRKWNVVSDIGKLLDTVADKFLSISTLILLICDEKLIIITIILELIIATINIYKKYNNLNPKTLKIGKVKTVFLCIMISCLLLSKVIPNFKYIYIMLFIMTSIFQIEAIKEYKSFH
ncbi:MAG: CDP-alcohol phosphatidyltransferase family protein [Bacilli bacterium]|nr:CDP-alcohol phosphatidyltransferase family protein [Bacilli bacterium]